MLKRLENLCYGDKLRELGCSVCRREGSRKILEPLHYLKKIQEEAGKGLLRRT